MNENINEKTEINDSVNETPVNTRIKELETMLAAERRKFSFRLALTKAGVRSMTAAEAMADLSSAEYDGEGADLSVKV